ncbi:TBC1 domain family member 12 [Pelomyxa schiedti]|nr:TBC1 domain family member 12 [Pelomyxa schiedti]
MRKGKSSTASSSTTTATSTTTPSTGSASAASSPSSATSTTGGAAPASGVVTSPTTVLDVTPSVPPAVMAARAAREARIKSSLVKWKEIIRTWDTATTLQQKAIRDLWWEGLPSPVRGRLWLLALGNPQHITHDLFNILVKEATHAKKMITDSHTAEIGGNPIGKTGSVKLIPVDLPRTFAGLNFFAEGGPLRQSIQEVLEAFVCYRPDVGYVQGMSYLAAILLLNMDAPDAFTCMANILNRPCYFCFYCFDIPKMNIYLRTLEEAMKQFLPRIHKNFVEKGVSPKMFLLDWVLTIFSKALPLDVAVRVWDVYMLEGESFIFRVILGVMRMYQEILQHAPFESCVSLLTCLPQDIQEDVLFENVSAITMTPKKFRDLYTAIDTRRDITSPWDF